MSSYLSLLYTVISCCWTNSTCWLDFVFVFGCCCFFLGGGEFVGVFFGGGGFLFFCCCLIMISCNQPWINEVSCCLGFIILALWFL